MGGKPRTRRADRLRLVTINFWGIEAPLEVRLALAGRQLAGLDLDVVCMQEVVPLDGRGGRTTADVLADALGMRCAFRVSVERGQGPEGLAVLARHPILEVRRLGLPDARPGDARILLSVLIDHPAGPIWCHTTHLHYRLDDGLARERQVLAIDDALRELGAAPQLVCGDFNAPPDADEIRFLRGLTTLDGRRAHYQDAWLRCHPGELGLTWCAENELTRPLRSLDIDRRIDYVFVTTRHKDGRGTILESRVVLDEREGGVCASDHYGVLADVVVAPGLH